MMIVHHVKIINRSRTVKLFGPPSLTIVRLYPYYQIIKAAQPFSRNKEIAIMSSFPASGGRRRLGWTLFLLAFAQLVIAVDYNIVFVALPDIGAQLGFSRQTLQWVVSAYGVAFGGFLLLGGRAADLLGRRRIFIFALALYGASSLVGGLATSPSAMIIARAIQGVGGALLFPATLSLVTTLFAEGRERNRALAIWGGAGASGLTVGALLGGVLTSAYGWPAVFFVNVPLVVIIIAGALIVMPRDVRQGSHRSFDLPGALTATIGITLLVYVLVQGPESGWASPSIMLALVAGVILLAAFFVIEARSGDPSMPLRLFSNRYALAGMLLTLFFGATLGALPYFETVLFQGMLGFDALWTGSGIPGSRHCHLRRYAAGRAHGNRLRRSDQPGDRSGSERRRHGRIRLRYCAGMGLCRSGSGHGCARCRPGHGLDCHVDRRGDWSCPARTGRGVGHGIHDPAGRAGRWPPLSWLPSPMASGRR